VVTKIVYKKDSTLEDSADIIPTYYFYKGCVKSKYVNSKLNISRIDIALMI
jgi:hypothetical protein